MNRDKIIHQWSRFNTCPSLPFFATDDKEQFWCLNIIFNNKTGSLVLKFSRCEKRFSFLKRQQIAWKAPLKLVLPSPISEYLISRYSIAPNSYSSCSLKFRSICKAKNPATTEQSTYNCFKTLTHVHAVLYYGMLVQ